MSVLKGAETEYDRTCPSFSRIFYRLFFTYLIFKWLNSESQVYIQMKSLESSVCLKEMFLPRDK